MEKWKFLKEPRFWMTALIDLLIALLIGVLIGRSLVVNGDLAQLQVKYNSLESEFNQLKNQVSMGSISTQDQVGDNQIGDSVGGDKFEINVPEESGEYEKFLHRVSDIEKGDSYDYVRTVEVFNGTDKTIPDLHFTITADKPIYKASPAPFIEGSNQMILNGKTVGKVYEGSTKLPVPPLKWVMIALGANEPFKILDIESFE